jgi:hypothetical protein
MSVVEKIKGGGRGRTSGIVGNLFGICGLVRIGNYHIHFENTMASVK